MTLPTSNLTAMMPCVVIEETRAWANFEVVEALHETELKDWSRYGRIRR